MAYLLLHRYEEAVAMFNLLPESQYRSAALKAAGHALMRNAGQARLEVRHALAARPGLSIRQFMAKVPFREAADAEHLAGGLRLAGLPE